MERERFNEALEEAIQIVLDDLKNKGTPEGYYHRIERCIRENTLGGKVNRGLSVLHSGQSLLDRSLTDAEFRELSILGWLTELFQAGYLIHDDIMDGSELRRGKPCWYKVADVRMAAVNDACLLKSCIFVILKQRFHGHPAYIDMLELFQDVGFHTELGQLCDTISLAEPGNMNDFTPERYTFIATHKTAFYSFYLPVALALYYMQRASEKNLAQARKILLDMGEYFQVQDDFLDVFGDPTLTGKVGTDIQDNKCTWIVTRALQCAGAEEKRLLCRSYGQPGASHATAAKKVFEGLCLRDLYHQYEQDKVQSLRRDIDAVDETEGLQKEVFVQMLDKIYKRGK
ncbi:isoprenoid synthase domain-containing protein [Aspergillus avenaceus]|uniref:Isoprenoid synthase domain-containing protein n=1 Tax=Aspergillus avenaceus TaxID=36643 RepID=A0A5N6U7U2_ASPAV|nr:isoprenoid synthase domain-containing protein [Aspergillus avenaceus]